MQGRSQFQGQAPSNMDFPTEAYVSAHGQAYRDVGQAYAKAAEIESQAKQKMVGDLAQGALSGFGAYKKGVQAEKDFSAGRAMLDSPYFQKIFGMNSGDAADFGSYLDQIKKDQGVETANKVMDSSLGNVIKYAQAQQDYSHQIGLIGARTASGITQDAASQYLKLAGTPSATFPATVNPAPQAVPIPAAMPPAQVQGGASTTGGFGSSAWDKYKPLTLGGE